MEKFFKYSKIILFIIFLLFVNTDFSQKSKLILYRYHDNTLMNNSDDSITINGTAIAPHSHGSVRIMGDSVVFLYHNGRTFSITTVPSKNPEISLTKLIIMNQDTKVTILNEETVFKAKIFIQWPRQTKISFGGPIAVKKKENDEYDIKLDYLNSKDDFDKYSSVNSPPFKIPFSIIVTDTISGYSAKEEGIFIFGEY